MTLRLALSCVCLICTLTSVAQKSRSVNQPKGATLFTVNNKPVSVDEFIYLYKKNHQNPETDFTREKIEEYLGLYINFKLKVEEARSRGMDTTRAFIREYSQYKDELRKPYLPGNGMADSLTKMAYERMKEEVHAAHILISVKPDATPDDTLSAYNRIVELRKRVLGGEDFKRIAAEFSEDPSAKMNFGDLGFFTALQMVYPFENAAYNTPVGKVSAPIRTRFGYHILTVYERRPSAGEIEVAHIMIRTGEEKDNEKARNQIFAVFDQLEAGRKWEDLCSQYSDDPGTKDNGGKLRPFRAGMMSNVPEFEKTAFELERPGQYSDPFQTQYGWHIVRLERKIPLAPYDELAPSLKTRISRDERTQISKQALQARLRKDLGLQENSQTKSAVMAIPDSVVRKGTWNRSVSAREQSAVLFKLANRSFKTGDFLKYATRNFSSVSNATGRLNELYNRYIDEVILELQEERIKQGNPEYVFLINEYYEGILLFEIMEREVWNKASEDSVGQRKYFEANKTKFTAGPRSKATLYSASSRDAVEALKGLISENANLQEHIAKNKIRAESGYFAREDKAVLERVPWEQGLHTAENNGMYYLAWLKEILPAGQMSFEEARPLLITDYQNQLEQSWITQLKRKYPVKINSKGQSIMFSKLERGKS